MNRHLNSLKSWLKSSSHKVADSIAQRHWRPTLGPAQRLLALNESHALQGPALHAWCRGKGLFVNQLKQWREAFCNQALLSARAQVYEKARQANLLRWSGQVRDWSYVDTVHLNPRCPSKQGASNHPENCLIHHLLATSTLTTTGRGSSNFIGLNPSPNRTADSSNGLQFSHWGHVCDGMGISWQGHP